MITELLVFIYKYIYKALHKLVRWYKVPRWVKRFPYEVDKKALSNLAHNTKGALHKPRQMTYVLSGFSGKKSVENAVFAFENAGWDCNVLPQADAPGKSVIEVKREDYEITEEHYLHDVAFVNRIANMYHAEYAGWHAGGKPRLQESTRHRMRWVVVAAIVVIGIGIRLLLVWHVADNVQQATRADGQANLPAQSTGTVDPKAVAPIQPAPAPAPAKADDDLPRQSFNSADMGVSMQYPGTWQVWPPRSCTAGAAATDVECQASLTWTNWTQRYAPTITVQRLHGPLAQVVAHYNDEYDQLARQSPGTTTTHDSVQINGWPAERFTQTANGSTSAEVYIMMDSKVIGILGSTPRGTVQGMDYFGDFAKILATVKPYR